MIERGETDRKHDDRYRAATRCATRRFRWAICTSLRPFATSPQHSLPCARNFVQAATSPQAQAEIRHEISEIQQELTEAHPRGGVVRSRWGRVATALGPVATTSGAVAQ